MSTSIITPAAAAAHPSRPKVCGANSVPGRTGPDRAGPDRTGSARIGQNQTGLDRTGSDRIVLDRSKQPVGRPFKKGHNRLLEKPFCYSVSAILVAGIDFAMAELPGIGITFIRQKKKQLCPGH